MTAGNYSGRCTARGCDGAKRSSGAAYCEKHYMRMRRYGSLDRVRVPAERLITAYGYVSVYRPGHPLAYRDGRVLEHRAAYFDAHGHGPFECHWCGVTVTWDTLHIDHLNDEKTDNSLSNLVASCAACNVRRGVPKMTKRMREKGVRLRLGDDERCLSEWAQHLDISMAALQWRLKNWSVRKALTATKGNAGPASRRGRHKAKTQAEATRGRRWK